jgi:formylglycine-generating enzyme required for sulfatase activity
MSPAGSASANAAASVASPPSPAVATTALDAGLSQSAPGAACPEGMLEIPGGDFWAGNAGTEEASPRFLTKLAPFCLDKTEVTTARYRTCVEKGACTSAKRPTHSCNYGREGRGEHPINCVDWEQAAKFCEAEGARLPTEIEWEFAARGGAEQRAYSWGKEAPDGRTCWKHLGTCKVGEFAPGAFGLLDMTGNVWEWTSSWYWAYPWPPLTGHAKSYRGGSWSRRFEKWLDPTLRNRSAPHENGSHLGFRCAATQRGATCPFGVATPSGGGGSKDPTRPECLHGVVDIECDEETKFNGLRCTRKGAPRCNPGFREEPGHGCVLATEVTGDAGSHSLDLSGVVRARSPEFDEDCAQNRPTRPHAFRFTGGTHEARNLVGQKADCKNRDVGVGWNSSCCP